MTDCYGPEESFLSLIGCLLIICRNRDKISSETHLFNIWTIYKPWTEPKVKLSLLRSISLKILPQKAYFPAFIFALSLPSSPYMLVSDTDRLFFVLNSATEVN